MEDQDDLDHDAEGIVLDAVVADDEDGMLIRQNAGKHTKQFQEISSCLSSCTLNKCRFMVSCISLNIPHLIGWGSHKTFF